MANEVLDRAGLVGLLLKLLKERPGNSVSLTEAELDQLREEDFGMVVETYESEGGQRAYTFTVLEK